MLKRISIHNFKVLKDVSYEPAPLNVLMGLNGVGKRPAFWRSAPITAITNEQ